MIRSDSPADAYSVASGRQEKADDLKADDGKADDLNANDLEPRERAHHMIVA